LKAAHHSNIKLYAVIIKKSIPILMAKAKQIRIFPPATAAQTPGSGR
jgi:hypothetical protein